jgi:uncharacterized membrane protein
MESPPRFWMLTRQSGLRYLVIFLIAIGIWFRGANLDHKVFWNDEAMTALRISGYTTVEADRLLATAPDLSFADLQPYLSPNRHKNLQHMVQGLAMEDPHLPLFYFLLARFWAECWGGSITVLRSLSVVFSLLSLPTMFWLCLELFRSRQSAWIGTVLLAVSPFHVLYAQEARYYSLWIFITLLSSLVLLRSLKHSTLRNWSLYGILVTLGIYSHFFHVLIIIGHGAYVLFLERFRLGKQAIAYLVASALGLLAVFPWLLNLVMRREQAVTMMDSTLSIRYSLVHLMAMGVGNISRLFFDVGLGSGDSWQAILPAVPFILALTALVIYAFYFLYQRAEPRISGFITTLTFTPTVFYLASDLLIGGRLSGLPRYAIGLLVGVQLAVTYLLTQQVKRSWNMILALVLASSLFSCALSFPAIVWWHKSPLTTGSIPQVAALLHPLPRPYIITDQGFADLPALAHQLQPTARFQWVPSDRLPRIPPDQPDVFVFRPSQALLQKLSNQTLSPLLPTTGGTLYRLEKSSPARR